MRYSLLIIISLFFFIYPIFLRFFPIPLDRVLQIIGFFLFLNTPRFRSVLLNSKEVHKIMVGVSLIILLAFIAYAFNFNSSDTYFLKIAIDSILYFFSAYLIIFLIYKYHSRHILLNVFKYLVAVYILQSIFSFIFFFNPESFDIYISLLKQDNNANFMDRLGLLQKRLIGIGGGFFLGVVKYGVGLFILVLLPFIKKIKSRVLYVVILTLVTIAGVMTGRTFFVAVFLAIGLFILIDNKNGLRLIFKVIPVIICISVLVMYIAEKVLDTSRLEQVSNYLFELFVTFEETGTLSTTSSDATLSMYIFPESIKTWLIGDGKMIMPNGSYYKGSDVGFVRLMFYFGIISTSLYFLVKLSYMFILVKLTNLKPVKIFFFLLFIWTLILNLKGLASLDQYIVLFLLAMIYDKNLRKKVEII